MDHQLNVYLSSQIGERPWPCYSARETCPLTWILACLIPKVMAEMFIDWKNLAVLRAFMCSDLVFVLQSGERTASVTIDSKSELIGDQNSSRFGGAESKLVVWMRTLNVSHINSMCHESVLAFREVSIEYHRSGANIWCIQKIRWYVWG